MSKTFGEMLAALRAERGLSRRQLADLAGLDPTHYGRLEAGRIADPAWSVVCRLAAALKIEVGEFSLGNPSKCS